MKEWNIGDTVSKSEYTECAIFCNKKGDRHIEHQGKKYIVCENEKYVPTKEEILLMEEQKSGLNRAMREIVLAENSGASEYNIKKAKELEKLAEEIREGK